MNNPFCLSQHETEDERFIRIQNMDHYYKCISCNGTGLENYITYGELTLWDGTSKCPVCNGLGVFDWVENTIYGIKTKMVENDRNL